jgi:hypothetical protein
MSTKYFLLGISLMFSVITNKYKSIKWGDIFKPRYILVLGSSPIQKYGNNHQFHSYIYKRSLSVSYSQFKLKVGNMHKAHRLLIVSSLFCLNRIDDGKHSNKRIVTIKHSWKE